MLKEFEFPVSPILEYAIQEKEKELSNSQNSQSIIQLSTNEYSSQSKVEPVRHHTVVHQPRKGIILRIYRPDGSCIEEAKAAETMRKAVAEIGAENVASVGIKLDGMNIVTLGGNPKYPGSQQPLGNGYFLNTHSGNRVKQAQLQQIFDFLHIPWKVKVIE